jgi:hypothetical protein
MGSGAVVDERPTRASQLVVEADNGGEGEEGLQDALSEGGERSRSMAFERQAVVAGPEDALDALADRREVVNASARPCGRAGLKIVACMSASLRANSAPA